MEATEAETSGPIQALTASRDEWRARAFALAALAASRGATPEQLAEAADGDLIVPLTATNVEGSSATLWGTHDDVTAFGHVMHESDASLRHMLMLMHRRAQAAEARLSHYENYAWILVSKMLVAVKQRDALKASTKEAT